MGILTSFLSLFGCTHTNKHIITVASDENIYPKDHKLTMQERKKFTNEFLKKKNVPTLEHLPFVDDYTEARFRNQKEIACKAVVLYGLLFVAHDEKTAQEMLSYYKKYNLWTYVSPEEREYLTKSIRTDQDNSSISWRIEALNVLLWSLGNFEKLPFPTTTCDFSGYYNLPDLNIDPTAWINSSKLRSTEDILNETDLIYRIHWATRDASLKNQPIPAEMNQDVIMERHFALNWLTMYADEWDEVTTDT